MLYYRWLEQHNNTLYKRKGVNIMKAHISIKKVKGYWKKNFCCGYCELQDIMKYREPTYYNSGIYGWNCDVYTDYKTDIAITTGYRNMTGRQIPAELIEKYSRIAKNISIMEDFISATYEEVKDAYAENIRKFFDELDKI